MSKFWELLEQSVIIQGTLALAIIGTMLYMLVQQMEIPKELWGLGGMILGSYFTGKGVAQARSQLQRALSQKPPER